jgi:hypothetical protein
MATAFELRDRLYDDDDDDRCISSEFAKLLFNRI